MAFFLRRGEAAAPLAAAPSSPPVASSTAVEVDPSVAIDDSMPPQEFLEAERAREDKAQEASEVPIEFVFGDVLEHAVELQNLSALSAPPSEAVKEILAHCLSTALRQTEAIEREPRNDFDPSIPSAGDYEYASQVAMAALGTAIKKAKAELGTLEAAAQSRQCPITLRLLNLVTTLLSTVEQAYLNMSALSHSPSQETMEKVNVILSTVVERMTEYIKSVICGCPEPSATVAMSQSYAITTELYNQRCGDAAAATNDGTATAADFADEPPVPMRSEADRVSEWLEAVETIASLSSALDKYFAHLQRLADTLLEDLPALPSMSNEELASLFRVLQSALEESRLEQEAHFHGILAKRTLINNTLRDKVKEGSARVSDHRRESAVKARHSQELARHCSFQAAFYLNCSLQDAKEVENLTQKQEALAENFIRERTIVDQNFAKVSGDMDANDIFVHNVRCIEEGFVHFARSLRQEVKRSISEVAEWILCVTSSNHGLCHEAHVTGRVTIARLERDLELAQAEANCIRAEVRTLSATNPDIPAKKLRGRHLCEVVIPALRTQISDREDPGNGRLYFVPQETQGPLDKSIPQLEAAVKIGLELDVLSTSSVITLLSLNPLCVNTLQYVPADVAVSHFMENLPMAVPPTVQFMQGSGVLLLKASS